MLIIAVSIRELFRVLALGLTILPANLQPYWQRGENIFSVALNNDTGVAKPIRQGLLGYLHLAGIEGGYGFFAPNFADSYQLVFELSFADGRIETELPRVYSDAAGLRLASFLDRIGRPQPGAIREAYVRLLVFAEYDRHPEVTHIRATLRSIDLARIEKFSDGIRPTSQVIQAYDYDRAANRTNQNTP